MDIRGYQMPFGATQRRLGTAKGFREASEAIRGEAAGQAFLEMHPLHIKNAARHVPRGTTGLKAKKRGGRHVCCD